MFRYEERPFNAIFSAVNDVQLSDHHNYTKDRRYSNLIWNQEDQFPDYNANLFVHAKSSHILMGGAAQYDQLHIKRFFELLGDAEVGMKDIIAAGNPLDGRNTYGHGRGFLDYFNPENKNVSPDRWNIAVIGRVDSKLVSECGQIKTYEVTVEPHENDAYTIKVHNIPNFGDFKTVAFTVEEIERLLEIHMSSDVLGIHCSAGLGRTGVLELAFQLFAREETFYQDGKPNIPAIINRLGEMRKIRPGLVQTSDQLRMAIVLGRQLVLAQNKLLDQKSMRKTELSVDAAASQYVAFRKKMRQSTRSVACLFAGYAYYNGESSEDVQNGSSEESPRLKTMHK